jgi:DNA-binding SARP family transcriptional activator
LALLKAIVAMGGRDVPHSRLIDALWSEDEGDAGKQALGVTLVRLRKLLGAHDAIQVAEERVSVNPALCWVDAWAFERRLKQAEALRAQGKEAEGIARLHDALALYQGQFLPAEAEETWSVQPRLRLRGLVTTAIEDLGEHHEARAEWERAVECYRRGLEADDLIEEFYLGLMRCYRALGRSAEGMAVYRRLRQTLSVVLGVAPSDATEAAARALRDGGSPAAK